MSMSNAANTVEIRNSYKALMAACLRSERKLSKHLPNNAECFNNHVTSLMHELADGEDYEMTPAYYYRAAQQVAFEVYGVNFRNVAGCVA